MTEPDAPDIDRRLREAFGDDAAAAARVARVALSEDEARGRSLAEAVLQTTRRANRVVWARRRTCAHQPRVAGPPWRPGRPWCWWHRRWHSGRPGRCRNQRTEPPAPPSLLGLDQRRRAGRLAARRIHVHFLAGGRATNRPPDGSGIVIVEGGDQMTRTASRSPCASPCDCGLSRRRRSRRTALSKRVSLDLKAMAPADAFKVVGDSVGMKVTVDAEGDHAHRHPRARRDREDRAQHDLREHRVHDGPVANGAITVTPARRRPVCRSAGGERGPAPRSNRRSC